MDISRQAIRQAFETTWSNIIGTVEPAQLGDSLQRWWPTILGTTPRYDVLAQNLVDFPLAPYITLLTVYYYGYADAIDAIMEERIDPALQSGPRVPPWLNELVLGDIIKRFGDKH